MNRLNMSLRGAWQSEAVLPLRTSGKSYALSYGLCLHPGYGIHGGGIEYACMAQAMDYACTLVYMGGGIEYAWIMLAPWRVTLKTFVVSTMRTCLLTTCALALAPVCSGVFLACVGLPPSLQGLGPG